MARLRAGTWNIGLSSYAFDENINKSCNPVERSLIQQPQPLSTSILVTRFVTRYSTVAFRYHIRNTPPNPIIKFRDHARFHRVSSGSCLIRLCRG